MDMPLTVLWQEGVQQRNLRPGKLRETHAVCCVKLRDGAELVGVYNTLHKGGATLEIWQPRYLKPGTRDTTAESKGTVTFNASEVLEVSRVAGVPVGKDYEMYKDIKLGSGAQGAVYLGRKTGTPPCRFVAVKEVEPNHGSINREARLEDLEQHSNIIKLLARVGDLFVLELLDTDVGQLAIPTFETVRNYTRQVLQGVGHLHEGGVVHMDLKPENLMFSSGVIKISDFSSSTKPEDGEEASTATPYYMAPEAKHGPNPNEMLKCDMYSIGMTTKVLCEKCDERKVNKVPFDLANFVRTLCDTDVKRRPLCAGALELLEGRRKAFPLEKEKPQVGLRLWRGSKLDVGVLQEKETPYGAGLVPSGVDRVCAGRGGKWVYYRGKSNVPALVLEGAWGHDADTDLAAGGLVGHAVLGEPVPWATEKEDMDGFVGADPAYFTRREKSFLGSIKVVESMKPFLEDAEPDPYPEVTYVALFAHPVAGHAKGALVLLYGGAPECRTPYDCCYPIEELVLSPSGVDEVMAAAHTEHMLRVAVDHAVYEGACRELELVGWQPARHSVLALVDAHERGDKRSAVACEEGNPWVELDKVPVYRGGPKADLQNLPKEVLPFVSLKKYRIEMDGLSLNFETYITAVYLLLHKVPRGRGASYQDNSSNIAMAEGVRPMCNFLDSGKVDDDERRLPFAPAFNAGACSVVREGGWKVVGDKCVEADYLVCVGDGLKHSETAMSHVRGNLIIMYCHRVLAHYGLDVGVEHVAAVPSVRPVQRAAFVALFVPRMHVKLNEEEMVGHAPNAIHSLTGLTILHVLGIGEETLELLPTYRLVYRAAGDDKESRKKLLKIVNRLHAVERVKMLAFIGLKILQSHTTLQEVTKKPPLSDDELKTTIASYINDTVRAVKTEAGGGEHSPTRSRSFKSFFGW